MSRLDELIQELCPNGVEEKRLGDIATVSRGGNFQKKDYVVESKMVTPKKVSKRPNPATLPDVFSIGSKP